MIRVAPMRPISLAEARAMEPGRITLNMIVCERNAEVRRVLIDRFGVERFVKEASHGKRVKVEPRGALYRIRVPGDEAIVIVRVKNSSPEPDGTYKDYWLRVPPHIFSVQEAIAWTFGKNADEYDPKVET